MGKILQDFIIKKQNTQTNNTEKIIDEVNTLSLQEVRKLRAKEISHNDFDLNHLPKKIKEQFLNLLLNSKQAFSKSYKTLGKTSLVQPEMKFLHNFPLQTKVYKVPQSIKSYAQKEINDLLEAGLIKKSKSHYCFPVV